jgi:hypothetical protein
MLFAYSVVALFILALCLDDLAALVSWIFEAGRTWDSLPRTQAIALILKLGFGLGLFFGSHGLVRVWSRLRYSGLRRKMGLCVRCGYDLTGNTSGVCPECGTPIEAPGMARQSRDRQGADPGEAGSAP